MVAGYSVNRLNDPFQRCATKQVVQCKRVVQASDSCNFIRCRNWRLGQSHGACDPDAQMHNDSETVGALLHFFSIKYFPCCCHVPMLPALTWLVPLHQQQVPPAHSHTAELYCVKFLAPCLHPVVFKRRLGGNGMHVVPTASTRTCPCTMPSS